VLEGLISDFTLLSVVAFQGNGATIEMVGIGMGMAMQVTLMSGMAEWQVSLEHRLA